MTIFVQVLVFGASGSLFCISFPDPVAESGNGVRVFVPFFASGFVDGFEGGVPPFVLSGSGAGWIWTWLWLPDVVSSQGKRGNSILACPGASCSSPRRRERAAVSCFACLWVHRCVLSSCACVCSSPVVSWCCLLCACRIYCKARYVFLVWYRRVDMLRDKCLEGSLPAAVAAAATAAWFRFFDYLAARGGLRKPRWCLRLFASAGTVFGRALWEPGGCFVPRAVRCVFGKPVGCVGGGSPCCCGWNSCGLSVHRCAGSLASGSTAW